jgi:DNA-binding PadR family transcriptional regulator
MRRRPNYHRNLWALTVLSFLRERSMHPYEMQRLIRERHKERLLALKPGSLYHAINRLENAGLIAPVETTREGRRPERTTYRITDDGEEELLDWLRELLTRPTADSTEFLAALEHMPHLLPNEVADCLRRRAALLEAEIAGLETILRTLAPQIGRVVLLEEDLARAWKQTELAWVRRLIHDLETGVHRWDPEELAANPDKIPGLNSEAANGEEEMIG